MNRIDFKNIKNWFVTSDEHYFHTNIIKYCNRPFKDVYEMNNELIKRHNEIVGNVDCTIHCGDFTLDNDFMKINNIIDKLNGYHFFLRGSHDRWLHNKLEVPEIYDRKINGQNIVFCHYAMYVWPKSHYNSWLLYGHSHGGLDFNHGKSLDIGVDTNNFYPYSMKQITEIMEKKPDNFNLIKRG